MSWFLATPTSAFHPLVRAYKIHENGRVEAQTLTLHDYYHPATIARSANVCLDQRGTAHSAPLTASADSSRRAGHGSRSSTQPLSDLTSMQGPLRIPSTWSLDFFKIIEKAR